MKKIVKLLTAVILVVCICLGVSACTFIKADVGGATENGGSENGNTGFVSGGVGDGSIAPISYRDVAFRKNETADYSAEGYEKLLAKGETVARMNAVSKVRGSSVAINCGGGAGSGVIVDICLVDKSGNATEDKDVIYVLTCHHMISNKGEITVYFPDEDYEYNSENYTFIGQIGGAIKTGDSDAVRLIGGDFNSDIALLSVNISKKAKSGSVLSEKQKAAIRAAKVRIAGDDYTSKVAESVFSIGNPTGTLPGTVSTGTIAYVERENVSVSDIGAMVLMQIDVTSNPGNSGGGLYNLYGDLIGITNAGNTNFQNINFAIPTVLKNDVSETKNPEITNHGFKYCAEMLLSTASEDNYGCVPGNKQKFGFSVVEETQVGGKYIKVAAVTEDSPAAEGGLKTGDLITEIRVNDGENQKVTAVSELTAILKGLKIGDKFVLIGKRPTNGYSMYYLDFTTGEIVCQQFWFCYLEK